MRVTNIKEFLAGIGAKPGQFVQFHSRRNNDNPEVENILIIGQNSGDGRDFQLLGKIQVSGYRGDYETNPLTFLDLKKDPLITSGKIITVSEDQVPEPQKKN